MIEIRYDGLDTVKVTGHAEAGPKGKDLVCAGVTALVLALRENADTAELEEGSAFLCGGDPRVFRGICRGLGVLAEAFPECIHIDTQAGNSVG